MGCHHFIEEIALADCVVDVQGSGLTALLETAALVLIEAMVDAIVTRGSSAASKRQAARLS
jgi:hypothetical protein